MQKSKLRDVNKIQKRATGQENTSEDNLSIHEHQTQREIRGSGNTRETTHLNINQMTHKEK